MNPDTPGERPIRAFSDDNTWHSGDLVRVYTAGGGGWGDPLERDIALVEKDVRGGFVTMGSSQRDYGVIIDPETFTADISGSKALRRDLARKRGATKMFHRFTYFDDDAEERAWIESNLPR